MKWTGHDVALFYWQEIDRLVLQACLMLPGVQGWVRHQDVLVTGEREIFFVSIDELRAKDEHLILLDAAFLTTEDLADFLGE